MADWGKGVVGVAVICIGMVDAKPAGHTEPMKLDRISATQDYARERSPDAHSELSTDSGVGRTVVAMITTTSPYGMRL